MQLAGDALALGLLRSNHAPQQLTTQRLASLRLLQSRTLQLGDLLLPLDFKRAQRTHHKYRHHNRSRAPERLHRKTEELKE